MISLHFHYFICLYVMLRQVVLAIKGLNSQRLQCSSIALHCAKGRLMVTCHGCSCKRIVSTAVEAISYEHHQMLCAGRCEKGEMGQAEIGPSFVLTVLT